MVALAALASCSTSRAPLPSTTGDRIAALALEQLGTRYRYGGADQQGFDCSGLAVFVHSREGLSLPRTAAEQFRAGRRVPRESLRAGDLVFFRFSGRGVDHVGIYVGDGQFVHAPGARDKVRRAQLDAPWFAQRFVGATRYWRE